MTVYMFEAPKVVDNDLDEITAVDEYGVEVRGWSYANEAERRIKIRMAREFCEGWYQCRKKIMEHEPKETGDAWGGGFAENH